MFDASVDVCRCVNSATWWRKHEAEVSRRICRRRE